MLPVPRINLGYNTIAPYENIWDPPCKIRLISNLICHSIFRCNNCVYFLERLKWSPGCLPILSFNDKFPPFRRLTHVFISVLDGDVHIIADNGMAVFWWWKNSSNRKYSFPLSSTHAYMLSAVKLAEYYLTVPSSKCTSYCHVLMIGLDS